RWEDQAESVIIEHQHLKSGVASLQSARWELNNPLLDYVREAKELVAIEDTADPTSPFKQELDGVRKTLKQWKIRSWLIAPLIYQDRLLGVIELHHCQAQPYAWNEDDQGLVDAIATQLSVAIIQAEAYANLQRLNHQLAALERTRSNLIAITGHELRTPLSTIQVCLESLATEPDMPQELQQTMLDSALEDAERMRRLVQDFLTLSRLESGRIEWNLESLSLEECIDLSLSSIHAQQHQDTYPDITVELPPRLPLVRADGEWLVEVLVKLLNNACKFTATDETVMIRAQQRDDQMLEVIVADTGRGIEPDRLEVVFDRFYQEEGALRRTTGGTGLGLAMCRQIVEGLGGEIWATSAGKNQGSEFHFTLPVAQGEVSRGVSTRTKPTALRSPRHLYRPQESLLIDETIG
ncbi:histidine kinase, partial [filamentous cyanobacterium CCP5]